MKRITRHILATLVPGLLFAASGQVDDFTRADLDRW